ncbi:hypothetical protein LguiB_027016 [Lonicera macranthoides]
MIRAVLDDAEARQVHDKPIKLWMTRLKSVADEAVIALNEFAYEILPRKVMRTWLAHNQARGLKLHRVMLGEEDDMAGGGSVPLEVGDLTTFRMS